MTGYAAVERVNRLEIRPRVWGSSPTRDYARMRGTVAEIIDLAGDVPKDTGPETWADRLAAWHRIWAQATFYLFDDDSWL